MWPAGGRRGGGGAPEWDCTGKCPKLPKSSWDSPAGPFLLGEIQGSVPVAG